MTTAGSDRPACNDYEPSRLGNGLCANCSCKRSEHADRYPVAPPSTAALTSTALTIDETNQ